MIPENNLLNSKRTIISKNDKVKYNKSFNTPRSKSININNNINNILRNNHNINKKNLSQKKNVEFKRYIKKDEKINLKYNEEKKYITEKRERNEYSEYNKYNQKSYDIYNHKRKKVQLDNDKYDKFYKDMNKYKKNYSYSKTSKNLNFEYTFQKKTYPKIEEEDYKYLRKDTFKRISNKMTTTLRKQFMIDKEVTLRKDFEPKYKFISYEFTPYNITSNTIKEKRSIEPINNFFKFNALTFLNKDYSILSKVIPIEEENSFKAKKEDFNYLEINIQNKDNKNVIKALSNFMKNFKDKIKKKYGQTRIKVKFLEEKDLSFKICYQIPKMDFNFNGIEFFDDNFEKKAKNNREFDIAVKLIEGDKSLYSSNKINQYFLIFNGISVDKEDFYENLMILKTIALDLLLKK